MQQIQEVIIINSNLLAPITVFFKLLKILNVKYLSLNVVQTGKKYTIEVVAYPHTSQRFL